MKDGVPLKQVKVWAEKISHIYLQALRLHAWYE